jgi:hypothetical protein
MENVKQLKDITLKDKVKGTDNNFHNIIDTTDIMYPETIYEVEFSNGKVKCSQEHLWSFYVNNVLYTTDTYGLFLDVDYYKDKHFGTKDGPALVNVREMPGEPVMCITTDAPNSLFKIKTDKDGEVFTHNCTFRAVCGRLDSAGSGIALDSNLAATIDPKRKGAGIVKAAGQFENVQYYYSDMEWLGKYFSDRGLDELGYDKQAEQQSIEDIELGGVLEINRDREIVDISFGGVETEFDRSKKQEFGQVD